MARLGVETDPARARIGKGDGEFVDRRHHQVDVDGSGDAVVAQRTADHRPDGEVGDIVVVHHIKVHHIGAGSEHGIHFVTELREIRGEDRRRNQEIGHGCILWGGRGMCRL